MPRFTPDFLDELRTRLRPSDVIGRYVTLRKEGREFRGLSPFTNEKTPSFFVNDEKQRFFDFSSGKSGDIVGFLMEVGQMSFPEAVTQLADLAGLDLPEETPEAAAKAERAKDLAEACLEAAKFFRTMLSRQVGQEARDYLARRGLSEAMQRRFGVGYAPDSKTALLDHLINKDFTKETLLQAGLLTAPDDGRAPFDYFRDRVIFPIIGTRSRVIAFGGRALQKNAKAKYLNSRETDLFHKSHTLYNLDRARKKSAETKRPILVAEGYMDVIAIDEAGWPAVAPLGTALTEHQLELLWRSQDLPVLCFDGDRAGRKAAFRAIDRALPLLKPGKSLSFTFLPEGKDPDDLIRADGADAFAAEIEKARPFADVLWEWQQEEHPDDTPESAAAFRAALRARVVSIKDRDVRNAYGMFMGRKFASEQGVSLGVPVGAQIGGTAGVQPGSQVGFAEPAPAPFIASSYPEIPYAPFPSEAPPPALGARQPTRLAVSDARNRRGDRRRAPSPVAASPALKQRLAERRRGAKSTSATGVFREAVLVIGLVHHPGLMSTCEELVLNVTITEPSLSQLWQAAIDQLMAEPDLDSEKLRSHLKQFPPLRSAYEMWCSHPVIRAQRFLQWDADLSAAERGWRNALSIDRHQGDLVADLKEAAAGVCKDEGHERFWFDAVRNRAKLMADDADDEDVAAS